MKSVLCVPLHTIMIMVYKLKEHEQVTALCIKIWNERVSTDKEEQNILNKGW